MKQDCVKRGASFADPLDSADWINLIMHLNKVNFIVLNDT